MSERAKQSKKPAPWFRVFSAETITKTLGLNAAEFAVYFRLLLAMNEADEPVGGRALEMLPGLLGIRKKTFSDAVETLIERNLIERLADGLWSAKMDEERAFRDRKSDKARTSSVKRWRKTEQNQSGSDANYSHRHREPPQGGSRYENNLENLEDIDGPTSANAGRPDTGEDEPPSSYGDVGEPPDWFSQIPMPNSMDDYLVGSAPSFDSHEFAADHDDADETDVDFEDDADGRDIPFDSPSSAEVINASDGGEATPITAAAKDRATVVARKRYRWPEDFDLDVVYDEGGLPIPDDDADETDVDFEDDIDEAMKAPF